MERLGGQDVVVRSDVDAVDEGALFADGLLVEGFGRGGEEDGYVVAEDSGEDHYDCDGEEDPVARGEVISPFALLVLFGLDEGRAGAIWSHSQ